MSEGAGRALLQVLPVVLVMVFVAVAFMRHQAARQRQAQGVLWLQAMRTLITHIQRHRGLSAGLAGGDRSLLPRLEEAQLQVSRDFEQISQVGVWVKQQPDWQSITQHWARLAGNIHQLSSAGLIDQHNRLIRNILVFIDEIAREHYLDRGTARPNIWRDLLTLTEYMGQMRAAGTALAACGDVDEQMVGAMRRELQQLHHEVLVTLESPRYRLGLDTGSLQSVLDFLTYVDQQILGDGVQVSSGDFYDVATRSLDRLFERFDEELARVNRRLAH